MGLCEFSSTSLTDKEPPLVKKANSTYYRRTAWDYLCRDEMSCKNGGRCIITSANYNGYKCENFSPGGLPGITFTVPTLFAYQTLQLLLLFNQ
ncbi:predicted protein [Nematostella vectensis]|uniref:EGF-like domain-containing protein n=1 Tax=Nematostella vectensis TaxID=45351 RepID=A7SIP5_NEMVE|nr:predicted protein [Nematostella vectensis]|eukprot:XP_001628510.1 predicted protein [Nematostella vectensis]